MKTVLSINSGSSSIKVALFALHPQGGLRTSIRGRIESIGISPKLVVRDAQGKVLLERAWDDAGSGHAGLLDHLLGWIENHLGASRIAGVGHRVTHGGMSFAAPRVVDDSLLEALEALCPLAPLHQPHNLAAIRAVAATRPGVPQVACFDTAFHHDMPQVALRFALPHALHQRGIRRYGFHGLSYEYIVARLREIDPDLAQRRLIVAHLGNGASLCAIDGGRSVDTTMGFSALDGLVMGTRCGSLDPGVVLHLQTQLGMSVGAVEELLYRGSGLLGVSGLSSDMRTLAASPSPEAARAIELFVWRAAREAGALAASLGGVDGLVFTAGIGENDAGIRSRLCARLAWLGIALDESANASAAPVISRPGSAVQVRVMPTDEERMIARHTLKVLQEA